MGLGRTGLFRIVSRSSVWRVAGAAVMTMMTIGIVSALTAFATNGPLPLSAPRRQSVSHSTTSLSGSSYGADHKRMQAAANAAAWPQQSSQWCGVATVAAIARYQGSTSVTQKGVANYLNSDAAVSVWGAPSHISGYWGPGFRADISRDFGTDPRSLTVGLDWAANGHYHQFSATAGHYDASVRLAQDLERTRQPISVFVDHGLHSVIVSAVFSTTDPMVNPSGITGFQVWDPGWSVPNGNIQPDEYDDVPLSTWLGSTNYWGAPYNINKINGYIYDPDPAVGPYTYNPSQPGHAATLWSGHYVYIRPDPINVRSAHASVDWAFNQNGQLIKGFSEELSQGYRGTTAVWEGAKVTLSDSTPYSPAFSARGSYDPAAGGSAPAAALAWTGSDTGHHLNIMTTETGMSFGDKVTLSFSSITAPAALVAPPVSAGGQNVVMIAWDGTDSAHSLNVLYDVYNVTGNSRSVTLSYGSQSAPSLTWFGGQVWLAWTTSASDHTIELLPMGSDGLTPGAVVSLSSAPGASGGPSLSVDARSNRLLLSWAETGTNLVTFRVSNDGAQWTAPASANLPDSAVGGATLFVAPAPMPGETPGYPIASRYMVWTEPGGAIAARPFAPNLEPGTMQLLPESSPSAPAVGYTGSGPDFLFVWAGAGSTRHINVAQAQM